MDSNGCQRGTQENHRLNQFLLRVSRTTDTCATKSRDLERWGSVKTHRHAEAMGSCFSMPTYRAPTLLLTIAAVLYGCSAESEHWPSTKNLVNELTIAEDLDLWPLSSGEFEVDICFRKDTSLGTTPNWSNDKQLAEDALTETWEAASGVRFVFHGDCASNPAPSSWLPIELRYDASQTRWGGLAAVGYEHRLDDSECSSDDCQIWIRYRDTYLNYKSTVVHEVGHAIGFKHEWFRADWQTCSYINNPLEEQEADLGPDTTALTDIADVDSIMGNWECSVNRSQQADAWQLSRLDQVGVNILYPEDFSRSGAIRSWTGFRTDDGLLVREDSTLTTDWIYDGADSGIYDSVTWSEPGVGAIATGDEIPVSYVAGTTLEFEYDDAWDRAHDGVDSIDVNDSRHAALVGVVTQQL